MPKINLAQEALRNHAIEQRRRMAYIVSLVFVVIVAGVYAAFLLLTLHAQEQTATVRQEVADLDQQLQAREPLVRNVVLFRERLKSIREVLEQHVYISKAVEELERLTVPPASFEFLKSDVQQKQFEVRVRVPTMDVAADLVASLQHRLQVNPTPFLDIRVKQVRPLDALSTGVTQTGYAMTLVFAASNDAYTKKTPTTAAVPLQPAVVLGAELLSASSSLESVTVPGI